MSTQDTPSRPGRPPSLRDPQRAICDAAASLFAAKGYEGASLQDVASAVGMTKAGLYHYFRNKQDLFDSIVLGVLSDMLESARARVDGVQGASEQVAAFMVAHALYFEANRDHYRAAFIGRGGDLYVFTPEQMQARRVYTDFLKDILEAGLASGSFAFEDAPLVARGILGMLNWMTRWYNPQGEKSAEEIAGTYAQIVLKGIATD